MGGVLRARPRLSWLILGRESVMSKTNWMDFFSILAKNLGFWRPIFGALTRVMG